MPVWAKRRLRLPQVERARRVEGRATAFATARCAAVLAVCMDSLSDAADGRSKFAQHEPLRPQDNDGDDSDAEQKPDHAVVVDADARVVNMFAGWMHLSTLHWSPCSWSCRMRADEMTCALPAARLGEIVAAVEAAADLDRAMARYAGADAQRFDATS